VRVAALYDVHGNLPALEAVLAEVERERVDLIVVGGDVAAGPFPGETLELLRSAGATFVRGNADRELGGDAARELPALFAWAGEQLTDERRSFLAGLPLTFSLELEALGRVLFCHATTRSDEEIITRLTPEAVLREVLSGVEADLVVCGHVHVQYDRTVGPVRIVNAGSVGMPYEVRPGAFWALLEDDLELRRTEYDLDAAAARIRTSGWPEAEQFVRENLFERPSPDEVSEHFERLGAEGRA
jgi:putative phosphoesterase